MSFLGKGGKVPLLLSNGQEASFLSKPSELPDQLQNELEMLNNYITTQNRIFLQLQSEYQGYNDQIKSVTNDISTLERKLFAANEALIYDERKLKDVKKDVDSNVEDIERCLEVVTYLMLSPLGNNVRQLPDFRPVRPLKLKNDHLNPYFLRVIQEFQTQWKQFSRLFQECERALSDLEQNPQERNVSRDSINVALIEQYRLFMSLATKVADVHRDMAKYGSDQKMEG